MEGLHTEEEPLPGFVYSLKKDDNFSNLSRIAQSENNQQPPCTPNRSKLPCDILTNISNRSIFQNILPANPPNYGINQKMETPIIYFYGNIAEQIDIHIGFPKGIIKHIGSLEQYAKISTTLSKVKNGTEFNHYVTEAKALVDTWEKSYFHTKGPRVLFLLPQSESDRILPLKISKTPASLVRVLVGRIEFMTHEQEEGFLYLNHFRQIAKYIIKLR